MKDKNYSELKRFCLEKGADLFGIADISRIKSEFNLDKDLVKGLDRAVCIGVRLSAKILENIATHPTKLYFHHYRTLNNVLDQIALSLSNLIQREGFSALPVPASQIVDWQKQTAHLSHKRIGYLAGLGWLGRNNLLVNKELGAQFRLTTILTDMPLPTDKPIKDNCGVCKACISACPVSAIKEDPRDFQYLRCFEKLKEFQKNKFVEQYICGICVKACRPQKTGECHERNQ